MLLSYTIIIYYYHNYTIICILCDCLTAQYFPDKTLLQYILTGEKTGQAALPLVAWFCST